MRKTFIPVLAILAIVSCQQGSKLPAIGPDVVTEKTPNDTDDPAIWVNPEAASKRIVFGTDKETNGGVYAFDVDGRILQEKSMKNIELPNNVDLAYGFQLNDCAAVDVIAFTERVE